MDIDLTSMNRYRDRTILTHIDGNFYCLNSKFGHRLIFNSDGKTIDAIDPSGGPFLSVGDLIQGKKIKSISQTGILELEDVTTTNKS